jgi:hypothetical protein
MLLSKEEVAYNRIQRTLTQWGKEQELRYLHNLDMYEGFHYNNPEERRNGNDWERIHSFVSNESVDDRTVSNYVLPNVNIAVASTAGMTPDFRVDAEDRECQGREEYTSSLLNKIWDIIGGDRECQRVRKDSYIFGQGYLGIGWILNEETGQDDAEVFRISPKDSFPDPYAVDPLGSDWRFWFWREYSSVEEVLRLNRDYFDKLSDEEVVDAIKGSIVDGDINDGRCELYNYYSRDGRYMLFIKGLKEPIRNRENLFKFSPYTVNPFPVEVIPYVEVPDSLWSMSLSELIEDEQMGLNRITRRLFQYIKATIPKLQIEDEDAIEPETAERDLLSDRVNAVVRLRGRLLQPIQITNLPPEIWNVRASVINDIVQKVGGNEYSRGLTPDRRETATTTRVRAILSGIRANAEANDYRKLLVRVAYKLLDLYSSPVFGEGTRHFRWDDKVTGKRSFYKGNYMDCSGRWKITITAGSMEQKDRDFEKEAAAVLLQTLTPFIQSGDINIVPILKHFLEQWDIVSVSDVIMDKDIGNVINIIKLLPDDVRELLLGLMKNPELLGQTLAIVREYIGGNNNVGKPPTRVNVPERERGNGLLNISEPLTEKSLRQEEQILREEGFPLSNQ